MAPDGLQLSIVVPTYNERDNVEPLTREIFRHVDPATSELVFVDDDSPDDTAGRVAELAAEFPVRAEVRTEERGLATAVLHGLRLAKGEIIVSMDADLSHPPSAIPRLVEAIRQPGVEMVIGSRFVPGAKVDLHWPLHRRLNSWGGRILARPLTPVRDMMAGFFCVRRDALRFEGLAPVGYKVALELIVRHGWRNVKEVPITFSDRAAGETKLNVKEHMRYMRHLARLYRFKFLGRSSRGS